MRALARACLVAVLAAACATPVAPRPALTPTEEPAVLARAAADQEAIAAAVATYDDPALTTYLHDIADRLRLPDERANAGDRGDATSRSVAIVIVRDPTIDAFALPTGRIYLHTGLLARLENEAQVATVLARALSHLAHGDALARRIDDAEINAAIATIAPSIASSPPAITPAAGEEAGAARLSPMAAAILGKHLRLAYVAAISGLGVDAEARADVDAIARLAQAGYDVREAPRAFEQLRREAHAGGALETFNLGNDASLVRRIESMQRLAAASPAAAGAATPADEYAQRIVPVVRENASLEIRAGRFRLAQAQLERVLAATPGDALAHLYDGDLHRLRAQRTRSVADRDELARAALASYERCATLDPALSTVHRQLGLLYYQQRQVARALEEFARYVEQNPGAPDAARVAEYLAPPRVP